MKLSKPTEVRRRIGIAAFLALAIAFVLFVGRGRDEAPRPSDGTEVVEHEVASEVANEAVAEDSAAATTEILNDADDANDAEQRLVHITGTVFENGAPAGGAIVVASGTNDAGDRRTTNARSGDDGRFTLDIDAKSSVRLDATKGESLRGATIVPIRSEPTKDVRIVLKRAASVIATVTSRRDGAPVAGARVSCRMDEAGYRDLEDEDRLSAWAERACASSETDLHGKATLFIVHAGTYNFEAEHDEVGVVVGKFALELRDQPQAIALELPGGSAILGRVVDEANAPIADAKVWLSPGKDRQEYGYRHARTDQDGRFQIRGVEAGRFSLRARSSKHLQSSIEVEKKDATNDIEVELQLERGASIEGHVLDAQGAPAAGWTIFALSDTGGLRATSKKDGSFAIEPCPQGTFVLTLARPNETNASPFWDNLGRARAKAGDRGVVLRAPSAATLAGEVEFEGAEPPATYVITVEDTKHEQPSSLPEFRITKLSSGTKNIIASAAGFAASAKDVELVEGATVTVSFELRAEQRIAGKVIDRSSGDPIAGALVHAMFESEPGRRNLAVGVEGVRTGRDGKFAIGGLPAGALSLFVKAKSYVPEVTPLFEVGADTGPIIVRIARGTTVSGRVRAGDARPSWASVSLHDPDGDWWTTRETSTDDEGAFFFDGVIPGRHTLAVHASFSESSRSKELSVDVPATGLSEVDVDFKRSGARLTVALPAGTERTMYLRLLEGRFDAQSEPGNDGIAQSASARPEIVQVAFDGLQPGEYTLFAHVSRRFFDDEEDAPPEPSPIHITINEGDQSAHVTVPVR